MANVLFLGFGFTGICYTAIVNEHTKLNDSKNTGMLSHSELNFKKSHATLLMQLFFPILISYPLVILAPWHSWNM